MMRDVTVPDASSDRRYLAFVIILTGRRRSRVGQRASVTRGETMLQRCVTPEVRRCVIVVESTCVQLYS